MGSFSCWFLQLMAGENSFSKYFETNCFLVTAALIEAGQPKTSNFVKD